MSSNSYQQRHPLPTAASHFNHQSAQSPKHAIHHQSPRIMELLDALKHEIDLLHEESSFSKHQRKDLEAKCKLRLNDLVTAQITEMNAFQQSIFDLERVHSKMKQQYEDEIRRLRHELETRGIPLPPSNIDVRGYRKPSTLPEGIPAPNLSANGRTNTLGAFGNFMGGQNPPYSKGYIGK
jgi:glucose repression regulatory protein TUP1